MPRRCALGCPRSNTNDTMHMFPNPKKMPDLFKKWVEIAGGKIDSTEDIVRYTKQRVCDLHFDDKDRIRFNRLNRLAIPKNLRQKSTSEKDHDHDKQMSNEDTGHRHKNFEGTNHEKQSSDQDSNYRRHIMSLEDTERRRNRHLQVTSPEVLDDTEFGQLRLDKMTKYRTSHDSDETEETSHPEDTESLAQPKEEIDVAFVVHELCSRCGDVIPALSSLTRCVQCVELALLCTRCVSAAHAHHTHALMHLPNTRTYRILERIFQQLRLDVNELLSTDEQQQLQNEERPSSPISEPIEYYTIMGEEDAFYTHTNTVAYGVEVPFGSFKGKQPKTNLPLTKGILKPSRETQKKNKKSNILRTALVEKSPPQVVKVSSSETTVSSGVTKTPPSKRMRQKGNETQNKSFLVAKSPRHVGKVLPDTTTAMTGDAVTSPRIPLVVLKRMSLGSDVAKVSPGVTKVIYGAKRVSPSCLTVSQNIATTQDRQYSTLTALQCVWLPR